MSPDSQEFPGEPEPSWTLLMPRPGETWLTLARTTRDSDVLFAHVALEIGLLEAYIDREGKSHLVEPRSSSARKRAEQRFSQLRAMASRISAPRHGTLEPGDAPSLHFPPHAADSKAEETA